MIRLVSFLSLWFSVCLPSDGEESESESEVAQSCPTLCNPLDCSTPGLPTPGACSNSCPSSRWCHPTIVSFCLYKLFMGLSRQECWSGLPFPSPVDHVLSELSTKTHPSWVALYGMAHSFIELDKAVVHVIRLVSFCDCSFQSVCRLMLKDKRLIEASCGEYIMRNAGLEEAQAGMKIAGRNLNKLK